MKQTIFVVICVSLFSVGRAQLTTTKKCPVFNVDILNGTVNGLRPDRTTSEIKTEFPDSNLAQQAGQQLDLLAPKS